METSKFRFQGTLLVPVKNIETSLNFFWAGSLKAENNEVFVIVFKAENKDEFVPLLEKDLKILQDMEQTDSVKQQIAFIEKTLSETKNPVFIKVPDQQMLDVAQGIVSQYLRNNNYPVRFTRENVNLYIWYYCCLLTYVSKKNSFALLNAKEFSRILALLSHIIKDGVFVSRIYAAFVRYIVVNINDIGTLPSPGVEIANNLSR